MAKKYGYKYNDEFSIGVDPGGEAAYSVEPQKVNFLFPYGDYLDFDIPYQEVRKLLNKHTDADNVDPTAIKEIASNYLKEANELEEAAIEFNQKEIAFVKRWSEILTPLAAQALANHKNRNVAVFGATIYEGDGGLSVEDEYC